MEALFPDQREALLHTRRIAEMVDVKLPLGQLRIPHFPVPDGETVESWLRTECQAGLARRYGEVDAGAPGAPRLRAGRDHLDGLRGLLPDRRRLHPVRARAGHRDDMPRVGARGRSSRTPSGITPVDPIRYQLPFERFLNPDRVTMPDIDVDFEDSRRDEVIAYVTRKYGADHVAQIITFGTMLARAAIRDVGRVLGLGYGEVDRIAKAVPNQLGIRLEEALHDLGGAEGHGRCGSDRRTADRTGRAARGRRAERVHARGRAS